MSKGVPGSNILAVTFTNKAANEMRRRIKALLGIKSDSLLQVTVGTFHGICVQILRAHAAEAGLSSNFLIFDADQQQQVVAQAIAQVGLDATRFKPATVLSAISRLKSDGLGPDRALEFRGAVTPGQKFFLAQVRAPRAAPALAARRPGRTHAARGSSRARGPPRPHRNARAH